MVTAKQGQKEVTRNSSHFKAIQQPFFDEEEETDEESQKSKENDNCLTPQLTPRPRLQMNTPHVPEVTSAQPRKPVSTPRRLQTSNPRRLMQNPGDTPPRDEQTEPSTPIDNQPSTSSACQRPTRARKKPSYLQDYILK